MNKSLAYLEEVLASHADVQAKKIVKKLRHHLNSTSEKSFVMSLSEMESEYLNSILPDEMKHALESENFPRLQHLNEVYELL